LGKETTALKISTLANSIRGKLKRKNNPTKPPILTKITKKHKPNSPQDKSQYRRDNAFSKGGGSKHDKRLDSRKRKERVDGVPFEPSMHWVNTHRTQPTPSPAPSEDWNAHPGTGLASNQSVLNRAAGYAPPNTQGNIITNI
jgi:hypothetical protein